MSNIPEVQQEEQEIQEHYIVVYDDTMKNRRGQKNTEECRRVKTFRLPKYKLYHDGRQPFAVYTGRIKDSIKAEVHTVSEEYKNHHVHSRIDYYTSLVRVNVPDITHHCTMIELKDVCRYPLALFELPNGDYARYMNNLEPIEAVKPFSEHKYTFDYLWSIPELHRWHILRDMYIHLMYRNETITLGEARVNDIIMPDNHPGVYEVEKVDEEKLTIRDSAKKSNRYIMYFINFNKNANCPVIRKSTVYNVFIKNNLLIEARK